MNREDNRRDDPPTRLRQLLQEAGLSQSKAARVLDIEERTIRRYCTGAQQIPGVVWLALHRLRDNRLAALARKQASNDP